MSATTPAPDQSWPGVAVVVATRDRPDLLERAVLAICGQDYPGDIECLVVFDQSPPRDLDAGPGRPGGRTVRVLSNTRTPGLAGARNTGMLATTAPLLAFCDDDDAWAAEKVRRQIELLDQTGSAFTATGVRIHHGDRLNVRIPPGRVEFAQLVRERVGALHPSTFLFRRSLVDDIGLVDEAIPGSYGEDYDWLLRASRAQPIVSVTEALADVYWHKQSFFAERWATVATALTYMLDKYPELRADKGGRARIQGQIAFAQAAQAQRSSAIRTGWDAIRGNPRERRAYLALAVASGLVSASTIVRLANGRGRGV
jgi:glycosyltransferase involved in cell wall biosynthesis